MEGLVYYKDPNDNEVVRPTGPTLSLRDIRAYPSLEDAIFFDDDKGKTKVSKPSN